MAKQRKQRKIGPLASNRVIGYRRVSDKIKQAERGVSLEAQYNQIRLYCEMKGLELIEVITDKVSAGKKEFKNREGGIKITQMIADGLVGGVVASKLDRMFRNTRECLAQVEQWDRDDVAYHLVDMGGATVDTRSPGGKFTLTVLAGVAEMELNSIAERTRVAMLQLKHQGRSTGTPPYGKKRNGKDRTGRTRPMIDCPEEIEIMRYVGRLNAHGHGKTKISNRLKKDGYWPTRTRVWHDSTIRSMLKTRICQDAKAEELERIEKRVAMPL